MNTAELSASLELSVPINLAYQRMESGYVPGSFTDGHKLGLAVGSGGGAGPVSLGGLASLHELGVTKYVDAMYGVSIGAINLAAFSAGQTEVAIRGYNNMTQRGFVDKRRFLRIMDMRILERLLKHDSMGLNTDAVVRSPIPINVGVTRLSGGIRPVSFNLTEVEPDQVVDILVWGTSIPGVSGMSPRDSKGISTDKDTAYADGGFSIRSAADMAARDGCTDLIYLSNQPYNPVGDKFRMWQVALFGALMTPYDAQAIPKLSAIVRDQIASRKPFRDGAFRYGDMEVAGLFPPAPKNASELLPGLFNMDPRKITAGFEITKLHILNKLAGVFPVKTAPNPALT